MLYLPTNYQPILDVRQTEAAIKKVKDQFEARLAQALNLHRVSAPLFVPRASGLNDSLTGVERPISFVAPSLAEQELEIIHSLAKWKRMALYRYGYQVGEGLYTDMNAIRRDEALDNTHSLYVDQWDWERIVRREERTLPFLVSTVSAIYDVFKEVEDFVASNYPKLHPQLPNNIFFISAQELEDRYPHLPPALREDEIAKDKKAVFVSQIGGALKSGDAHGGRAPDYDDWSLNGDIIFWCPWLGKSLELSSMGIRVDADSLQRQLTSSGCLESRRYLYHDAVLKDKLPLTIGGGIGQSRICMFFLKKAHIGEVQASVWPVEIQKACEANNIFLL